MQQHTIEDSTEQSISKNDPDISGLTVTHTTFIHQKPVVKRK